MPERTRARANGRAETPDTGQAFWSELRRHQVVERLGRIGHWRLPAGEQVLRWSREAARIHGQPGAPSKAPLDLLLSTLSPDDRDRLVAALDDALARNRGFELEARLEGSRIVRMLGECERASDGRAVGVLVVTQDISEHRATLAALAAAEARQADFLEIASDWLWEMDAQLRFTYVSPQVERMGVPAADHLGRCRHELLRDEEITPAIRAHLEALERREPFRDFRYWRVGQDGRRSCVAISGKPIFDEDGAFAGYRGCGRDLTIEERVREELLEANRELVIARRRADKAVAELQHANAMLAERNADMARAQAEIRRAALHDALTGLPNREHLEEKLAGYARRGAASGGRIGLLHIDLDRFKQINETLGHAAGDAVLRHAAAVLSRHATPEDFVARIGADEFVFVCSSCVDEREMESLARSLIEEFERPLAHHGRECWFGASIGMAAAPRGAIRPAELLINADIALHRTKSQGRGCHRFFSNEMQRQIVRQKALADSILAAIKRAEFLPYYQPQICARDFSIVGVEALARWRHPVDGVLAPGAFLPVADDLGVVPTLDRMILESALEDLRRWRGEGLDVPKLSVNVSARRLLERDLIGGLARMALPRGVLAFELLETAFLDDPNETIAWNIDMLKEMGIEVELDDFGSGHASILSLVRLGPSAIKIARELVSGVTEDRTRCGLVRSIVEIGRTLGTRIIAEGVETAAQARLLGELGCDVLQGFHFARPMPADDFIGFARQWRSGRRGSRGGAA